jgi:hypothetical protein
MKALRLLFFLVVAVYLLPQSASAQQSALPKLTLTQVEGLVSSHVPDSTMRTQIERRGLAFTPTPAIVDSLQAKGAGPLTIAAVEALLPNTALGARPNKISATDPSGALIPLLEQNWNWQSHWRVFLGPTYFGTATSFGRGAIGTLRYSLAETSEYPVFRTLASKGLITLSELSIADAPTSLAPGVNIKIDFGAIVTLTEAGMRSGKVDEKEHNVTFEFGTYGVEKITSNTRVRIGEDDYRLVEGTYVLNIEPKFDDVWGERGWSRHRDFQFRALFKYDSTESKWEIAYASVGHGERAMDTGPRGGNFESEKVPQTLDQLRMTHTSNTTPAVNPNAPTTRRDQYRLGAGKVEAHTEPGSQIVLDGQQAGIAGADGSFVLQGVSAGNHELIARSDGYLDASSKFSLAKNEYKQISLPMEWVGGFLTVSAQPWDARIHVDGPRSFDGRATDAKSPVGSYTVTASSDGYMTQTRNFQIAAGEHHVEEVQLALDIAAALAKAAAGDQASLYMLEQAIERGEEVDFKVKTLIGYPYNPVLVDGTITVSKTGVSYHRATGGDRSQPDFTVSPDKILQLDNSALPAPTGFPAVPDVLLKVAIMNKKGTKEDKFSFQICNNGAALAAIGWSGNTTIVRVACDRCDNSLNVLFELLHAVHGTN